MTTIIKAVIGIFVIIVILFIIGAITTNNSTTNNSTTNNSTTNNSTTGNSTLSGSNLPKEEVYWYTKKYKAIKEMDAECKSYREEQKRLEAGTDYFAKRNAGTAGMHAFSCEGDLDWLIQDYNSHTRALGEYQEVSFAGQPFPETLKASDL